MVFKILNKGMQGKLTVKREGLEAIEYVILDGDTIAAKDEDGSWRLIEFDRDGDWSGWHLVMGLDELDDDAIGFDFWDVCETETGIKIRGVTFYDLDCED
jgi:hypothetical protein